MAQIMKKDTTRSDAIRLVQRLIRKGTPNYIIRDTLIEEGFSAYAANKIIRQVRRDGVGETTDHIAPHAMQVGLFVVTVVILFMIALMLVFPVQ